MKNRIAQRYVSDRGLESPSECCARLHRPRLEPQTDVVPGRNIPTVSHAQHLDLQRATRLSLQAPKCSQNTREGRQRQAQIPLRLHHRGQPRPEHATCRERATRLDPQRTIGSASRFHARNFGDVRVGNGSAGRRRDIESESQRHPRTPRWVVGTSRSRRESVISSAAHFWTPALPMPTDCAPRS